VRAIPIESVREAARHIYDLVVRTPLVRLEPSAGPAAASGTEIFLKLETLQPIGSFKLRGAHNVIRRLAPADAPDGVWTVSAGNAAQGVAMAARAAGLSCSVMVMDTAPATKVAAIEGFGARIVRASYDECWRTVEAHHSDRMRGRFVHPFDDDAFIAGNGTAALEILEDLPDVDAVIAPLGGGGLLAGVGAVIHALRPAARVFAAEPETAAPFAASLANRAPSYFEGWRASFVDGAGGKSVLPSMWPLLSTLVADSIVVPLARAAEAMRLVAERVHVIAEGAAACAVAAALTGRVRGRLGREHRPAHVRVAGRRMR
jgi:threonine dehydratase